MAPIFCTELGAVYPGFHASHTVLDVLVRTAYGIVDSAVGGFLFALLYNFFLPCVGKANAKDNAAGLARDIGNFGEVLSVGAAVQIASRRF
jgi:hypothetical protein